MDVQHLSRFDMDEGYDEPLPECLLPPLDGPQETDDCEAQVAADRYSYGGLMVMGRSDRTGSRPRKRPVLMLDDSEREQAMRQLDMVAVQDFGESVPMERPMLLSGLSVGLESLAPVEPVDLSSLAAPVDSATLGWSEPTEGPVTVDPDQDPGSAQAFDEADVYEDEAYDEGLDESAYGSLAFGARAEPEVPAPAEIVRDEPIAAFAAASPAEFEEIAMPAPAVIHEPAQPAQPVVRPGHALRARVRAVEDVEPVAAPSALSRVFAWLGALLRR